MAKNQENEPPTLIPRNDRRRQLARQIGRLLAQTWLKRLGSENSSDSQDRDVSLGNSSRD